MKAKEATGRAMFESGDWKDSEDEDSADEEDDSDDMGTWNLETMRKETERLREQKEEERLAKMNGEPVPDTTVNGVNDDDSQQGDSGKDADG